MEIGFDPAKRTWTLDQRGLDMAKAGAIFADFHLSREDDREEYGEIRVVTLGRLTKFVVICVWTERAGERRFISLRKAEPDEREIYLANCPA